MMRAGLRRLIRRAVRRSLGRHLKGALLETPSICLTK
jgi:hypothetical protein